MSEQDLAALGATDEGIATPDQEIEQETQGQAEHQPANDSEKPEPAEKTESQKRRERRHQHFQRLQEDATRAATDRANLQRELDRNRQVMARMAEPKEADFQDPFEYAAAKGGWRQAQIAAQSQTDMITEDMTAQSQAAEHIEQRRMAARQTAIAEDMPEARTKYADFDKAFAVATDSRVVSHALTELIIESDMALDLAYHLGTNPDVARQLSAMSPVAAARELGRLEATIQAPKPKLQSSAPAPISPLKGGSAGKSPESMNFKEFKAYRDSGGKL